MDRSLSTKYRPQLFEDLVGQENVKQILKKQIEEDNLRSAYLFVGAAGCGKTTSARCMARSINGSLVGLVEIDAASNSGVDSVRELTELSKFKPIGYKKKIYIIDECFHRDTLVNTPNGNVKISELVEGDLVYNLDGVSSIKNVFKNVVPLERLCLITINKKEILTTVDHLFFTLDGWVEARNLREGDVLIDYSNMSTMWEGVSTHSQKSKVLFETMCGDSTKGELSSKEMSELWEGVSESTQESEVLLCSMWNNVSKEPSETKELCGSGVFSMQETISSSVLTTKPKNMFNRVQEYPSRTIAEGNEKTREFTTYEDGQSNVQSGLCPKDDRCQASKWYTPCVGGEEPRREWEVHSTSTTSSSIIRGGVDFRISDTNQMSKESTFIPNLLQSRPRLTKIKDSDRGGWQDTSKEISTVTRLKERGMSNELRVDSIKIYERGSNEQYFSSYISDKERDDGFIILYDLEVVGHPSYFVDDILVHNCHSLSSAAFQAFLKTIEDGVKDVIFIFCTTERHKVPATIVSRCQVFEFNRINSDDIKKRLKFIQDSENKEVGEYSFQVTDGGLDYISKLANGGMRLAISMYEKVINCDTNPTLEDIAEILGTSSYKTMFSITEDIYNRDVKSLITTIEKLNSKGADFKLIMNDFVNFIIELTKFNYTQDYNLCSIPHYYLENYIPYESNFLFEVLEGLINCVNSIKLVDNPKNFMLGKLLQFC